MASVTEHITAEHRDIARVLKLLESIAYGPIDERREEDLAAMYDIVHYLRVYADALHHPYEEHYVFGPLRSAAPEHAVLLDALRDEHERAEAFTQRLSEALSEFAQGHSDEDVLRFAVRNYLAFQFDHMRREEEEVLPLLTGALDEETRRSAERAFAANSDPLFGSNIKAGFETLRRKIDAYR